MNNLLMLELFTLLMISLALMHALYVNFFSMHSKTKNSKIEQVASLIRNGAITYLGAQYRIIFMVGLLVSALLFYLLRDSYMTLAFILGAVASGLAGYMGMLVAVKCNSLTAAKAEGGILPAFMMAYSGGALVGSLVTGFALLCLVSILYIFTEHFTNNREMINIFIALSFGASLISVFARLGGGIFTKGADIGADLSGKLEAGIPEDDARNPAVIADNVGDNVGDCSGMVADLFETYIVTMSAAIVLAITVQNDIIWSWYPLLIGAMAIPASIIAHFSIGLVKRYCDSIMMTMYIVVIINIILTALGLAVLTHFFFNFASLGGLFTGWGLYTCSVIGLVLPILLILYKDRTTGLDSSQVRAVVKASYSGHATNVISGLAAGMESVIWPGLIVCFAIFISSYIAGIFGVAIAVSAMLSLSGVILAMDVYGPITDNAGGIVEMSGMPESYRKVTDRLDAVGNTTKAVTKGYAIGSAGLGAVVLFSVFMHDIEYVSTHIKSLAYADISYELANPYVVFGLLLGGLIPFLFSALAIKAVGKVANEVVQEVRSQFMDGEILARKRQPDYDKTIRILTGRSILGMIVPALLPVLTPILVYVIFRQFAIDIALESLGSMLLGTIVSGFCLAITMTSSGAIWDNAKKYFEILGLKNDPENRSAYEASITGDTVGDPCKDTAGPAINPMIKIVNVVSLLLLIFLVKG